MTQHLLHNNDFHDQEAPLFAFHDRIRYGDGVWDTQLVIVENGTARIIHADAHFKRLCAHAAVLQIEPPGLAELKSRAEKLIAENTLQDAHYALNTLITRGSSGRGLQIPQNPVPSCTMRIARIPAPPYGESHAIIAQSVRRNEGSPLSRIKSCNYGDNILALMEAKERGADTAIMLNNQERVTCATTANIFMVKDGRLYTPPLDDGVMNGVMRDVIMARYDVTEKSLSADDLATADALYQSSSIMGVRRIETLDGDSFPGSDLHIDPDSHFA